MKEIDKKIIDYEELDNEDRKTEQIELPQYEVEILQDLYLSCPSVKEGIKRIYLLGIYQGIDIAKNQDF